MGSTTPAKQFPNQLTPFNQSSDTGAVSQVKPVAPISASDQYQVGPSLSSIIPPATQPGAPSSAPSTPALGDSTQQTIQQLRQNRSMPFFGQQY